MVLQSGCFRVYSGSMRLVLVFLLFFFVSVPHVSADVVLPGMPGYPGTTDECATGEELISCSGTSCGAYDADPSYRYLTFDRNAGTAQYCKKVTFSGRGRMIALAAGIVGVAGFILFGLRLKTKKTK